MKSYIKSVSVDQGVVTLRFTYKGEAVYALDLEVAEAARLQALLLLAIADHANGATR